MFALELLIVGVLIALNGFLAMSELALVSANRIRLKTLANEGHRGAARALALAEQPGRFLSTVQIGITLAGVFAGAYSGATIALPLAVYLERLGVPDHLSETAALAIVVAAITYFSLILGELVPKQIGLRRAEQIAAWVAPSMIALSRLASPLVYVLDVSSRFVLRRLGIEGRVGTRVTEEEIKTLVAEAEAGGTVEPEEKAMITRVMRLGDRPVRAIMTPRREIDWIDLDADEAENRQTIRRSPHSRFPVARSQIDAVEGIVQTKDVLDAHSTKETRVESQDELVRRIDEASRFIPHDRLGICPQCGFSTNVFGTHFTVDDEKRKLGRLVEVADKVWGAA